MKTFNRLNELKHKFPSFAGDRTRSQSKDGGKFKPLMILNMGKRRGYKMPIVAIHALHENSSGLNELKKHHVSYFGAFLNNEKYKGMLQSASTWH